MSRLKTGYERDMKRWGEVKDRPTAIIIATNKRRPKNPRAASTYRGMRRNFYYGRKPFGNTHPCQRHIYNPAMYRAW